MEANGETLFDHMPEGAKLHVVYEGEEVPWGLDEIFGTGEFTRLEAVSYVTSPQFLSRAIERFESAEIILGIDNPRALRRVKEMLSGGDVAFYNGLSDHARDMVGNGALRVTYSDMLRVIHSKIYLLSDPDKGLWRVAMGSANLTKNAFLRGAKVQYEELVVFDGREMFDLYSRRFEALAVQTVDYLPEICQEKWAASRELIAVNDAEALSKALKEELETGRAQVIFQGSSAEYEELRDEYEAGAADLSRSDIETIEIYRSIMRKTKDGYRLRQRGQIDKAFEKKVLPHILSLTCSSQPSSVPVPMLVEDIGEDDVTRSLYYADAVASDGRSVDVRLHGTLYSEGGMSCGEVSTALESIESFIETYRTYTIGEVDDEYLSWIYEAILYAMASPMVADVRERASEERDDKVLANIPIYLAIGGRQQTGKSSLIDYIDRLLDGKPAHNSDLQHGCLIPVLGDKLGKYFDLGTKFPLVVDEMKSSFFASGSGDDSIKTMTNSLRGKSYGAIICTTNGDRYRPGEGATRRVKYIPLDRVFPKTQVGENAMLEAAERCPHRLENEFCARWLTAFDAGNESYAWSENGMPDSLVLARSVLHDLYVFADRDIPAYFPSYPVDLTTINAKKLWKRTWADESQREKFVPDRTGTVLQVKVEDLFSYKPSRRDLDEYTKGLPPQVLTETSGMYLILSAEQFFKWISEDNPFKAKRSRWKRFIDWCRA